VTEVRREDYGRRIYRPGEGPAARFIAARFEASFLEERE
jgi:hypothetical protein